jgi:hypothetical protein
MDTPVDRLFSTSPQKFDSLSLRETDHARDTEVSTANLMALPYSYHHGSDTLHGFSTREWGGPLRSTFELDDDPDADTVD